MHSSKRPVRRVIGGVAGLQEPVVLGHDNRRLAFQEHANPNDQRKERAQRNGNENQLETSFFPQSQPSSATTARPRPQRAPGMVVAC